MSNPLKEHIRVCKECDKIYNTLKKHSKKCEKCRIKWGPENKNQK